MPNSWSLIITGAVMVTSGVSTYLMAATANHPSKLNERLLMGVSCCWSACGVFAIIGGIVQVLRSWF